MTREQARIYSAWPTSLPSLVEEQKITAANAGVAMGKLLQVGAGYVYSNNPLYVSDRLDTTTGNAAGTDRGSTAQIDRLWSVAASDQACHAVDRKGSTMR